MFFYESSYKNIQKFFFQKVTSSGTDALHQTYLREFITEMCLTFQQGKLTRNPEKLSPIYFLIQ